MMMMMMMMMMMRFVFNETSGVSCLPFCSVQVQQQTFVASFSPIMHQLLTPLFTVGGGGGGLILLLPFYYSYHTCVMCS